MELELPRSRICTPVTTPTNLCAFLSLWSIKKELTRERHPPARQSHGQKGMLTSKLVMCLTQTRVINSNDNKD